MPSPLKERRELARKLFAASPTSYLNFLGWDVFMASFSNREYLRRLAIYFSVFIVAVYACVFFIAREHYIVVGIIAVVAAVFMARFGTFDLSELDEEPK